MEQRKMKTHNFCFIIYNTKIANRFNVAYLLLGISMINYGK